MNEIQVGGEPAEFKPIVQDIALHPGLYDGPVTGESKGERIVRQCVASGEPFFVLRAKDLLSVGPLKAYRDAVDEYEGDDPSMVIGVTEQLEAFKRWQRANPDKIRLPD